MLQFACVITWTPLRRITARLAPAALTTILLFGLGVASRAAQSRPQIDFFPAARVDPGRPGSIEAFGDHVAIGMLGGLAVVDVAGGLEPAVIGQFDIDPDRSITSVAIEGRHAYVTTDDGKALVVDIGAPSDPGLAGQFDLPDATRALIVDVSGNLAYLLADSGSALELRSYSLSDPLVPALLGRTEIGASGRAWDLDVVEGHAYVSGEAHLHIVDVSDASAPSALRSLPFRGTGAWYGLFVEDGIGYAAGHSGGLVVLDLSDPSMPTERGRLQLQDRRGRIRSVEEPATKLDDHLILPAGDGGIVVIDVSDLDTPSLVGNLSLPGSGGWRARRQGDRLFVIDRGMGLFVVDIEVPTRPELETSLEWPARMVGVHAQDGYALAVSGYGRALTYDVRDPYAPEKVGSLNLGDDTTMTGLVSDHGRAFATSARVVQTAVIDQIESIDLSDPSQPRRGPRMPISGRYVDVLAVCGDRLYSGGANGAVSIDIGESLVLSVDAFWSEPGVRVGALACMDDWLYAVAAPDDADGYQLITFDARVGEELAPRHRQPLDPLRRADTMFVAGPRLWVGHASGFEIYDISTPSLPQPLQVPDFDAQFRLREIEQTVRRGDLMFVSGDQNPAIAVIDLSDPTAPSVRGYLADDLPSLSIAVDRDVLVVGTGASGITTFEITGLEVPTASPEPSATPAPSPDATPSVVRTQPTIIHLPLLVTRRE